MASSSRFAVGDSSSDDEERFAVASDDAPAVEPRARHRRTRRRVALGDDGNGFFWAFVLETDAAGTIQAALASGDAAQAEPPAVARQAVGIVKLRWDLVTSSLPDATTDHGRAVVVVGPASGRIGFLQYKTDEFFGFADRVDVTACWRGTCFPLLLCVLHCWGWPFVGVLFGSWLDLPASVDFWS